MKFALIAIALTLGTVAHADGFATGFVQPLFSMANDRDANVDTYGLLVVNGLPASISLAPNGQADRAQMFNLTDISRPNGAVIINSQGHDVLIMQGALDPATQEGRLHIKYLANGLSNQYTTCDFLVKKNGNNWFAQNAYTGAKITNVKIITWSLGLKTLQGLCQ